MVELGTLRPLQPLNDSVRTLQVLELVRRAESRVIEFKVLTRLEQIFNVSAFYGTELVHAHHPLSLESTLSNGLVDPLPLSLSIKQNNYFQLPTQQSDESRYIGCTSGRQ